MVKLYTEELGRTEATAFGARKTKSRFGSRLEPFTTGIFLLYHKGEHSPYSIQDVEVTGQNGEIREDLNRFLIGNAVVEPVVRLLFEILSSTLELLSIIGITKGLYLLSMYDLNFLSIMGYKPDWDNCVKCSNPMQNGETFSDAAAGFPLCGRCHSFSSIAVSPGAMRFVEWALQTPLCYAGKVRMQGETLNQIRQLIEHLFLSTFQRVPDSWLQMKNMLDYSRHESEG
jgi:DNA repair protein RecO (recombination protein O)